MIPADDKLNESFISSTVCSTVLIGFLILKVYLLIQQIGHLAINIIVTKCYRSIPLYFLIFQLFVPRLCQRLISYGKKHKHMVMGAIFLDRIYSLDCIMRIFLHLKREW